MLKPFTGTWIEVQHHNLPEGKYWNAACRAFTSAQWDELVDGIHALGMTRLVMMCSAIRRGSDTESYFPGGPYPLAEGLGCSDPIEAILSAADKRGMTAFMSCGYFGEWTDTLGNMTSPEVERRAFSAMETLAARYGKHPSFVGWYLPDETEIGPYYDERFMRYVDHYAAFLKTLDAGKRLLIAPYGTNKLIADETYIRQLESLPVDYIAYQDEIGVQKSRPGDTRAYYEALRRAHDKVGRGALWCDMEVFDFEGAVYKSALIPSNNERVRAQLESVSDYVDEVLIYQYQGMLSRPDSAAPCGHPNAPAYWLQIDALMKEIRGQAR